MKTPHPLDPYRSLIGQWFAECPSLKATQVYQRLKERNVDIAYSTVSLFTQPFRKKQATLYHCLEFLPGEEAQVDWFFVNLPVLGKLCGFAMILSHSRFLFCHLFQKSSFEFFIEGHLKAFEAFGGLPRTLVYDNLSSVVLKRQPRIYNPRFLEFAHHYRFEIRLCNVAAGNEKGRVERVIRTLKETFFNAVSETTLTGLNQALHLWVNKKNEMLHRTTGRKPAGCLLEEKLKPLPQIPWNNANVHLPVKTTKTGLMIFETNAYSVPDYLVGQSLSIHASPDKIEIWDPHHQIASHLRSFARNQTLINPVHRSFRKISSEAKRERIFKVISNMDPVVARFLSLNAETGEDAYQTAYQLFQLLTAGSATPISRALMIAGLKECIQKKSPRLKTFVSLLHLEPEVRNESVSPQKQELLELTYKPRPLKDYDHE